MNKTWIISVVVVVTKEPRDLDTFFLGVDGTEEQAEEVRQGILKTGFTVGGDRFFADQIETTTIKEDKAPTSK